MSATAQSGWQPASYAAPRPASSVIKRGSRQPFSCSNGSLLRSRPNRISTAPGRPLRASAAAASICLDRSTVLPAGSRALSPTKAGTGCRMRALSGPVSQGGPFRTVKGLRHRPPLRRACRAQECAWTSAGNSRRCCSKCGAPAASLSSANFVLGHPRLVGGRVARSPAAPVLSGRAAHRTGMRAPTGRGCRRCWTRA
jgi:hypothetical protein